MLHSSNINAVPDLWPAVRHTKESGIELAYVGSRIGTIVPAVALFGSEPVNGLNTCGAKATVRWSPLIKFLSGHMHAIPCEP